MNRNELIFFAAVIVILMGYLLLFNMQYEAYLMIGGILLLGAIMFLIVTLKIRFENERISNIFKIIALLTLILLVITEITGFHIFGSIDLLIFYPVFIIAIIGKWIFEKKEEE